MLRRNFFKSLIAACGALAFWKPRNAVAAPVPPCSECVEDPPWRDDLGDIRKLIRSLLPKDWCMCVYYVPGQPNGVRVYLEPQPNEDGEHVYSAIALNIEHFRKLSSKQQLLAMDYALDWATVMLIPIESMSDWYYWNAARIDAANGIVIYNNESGFIERFMFV